MESKFLMAILFLLFLIPSLTYGAGEHIANETVNWSITEGSYITRETNAVGSETLIWVMEKNAKVIRGYFWINGTQYGTYYNISGFNKPSGVTWDEVENHFWIGEKNPSNEYEIWKYWKNGTSSMFLNLGLNHKLDGIDVIDDRLVKVDKNGGKLNIYNKTDGSFLFNITIVVSSEDVSILNESDEGFEYYVSDTVSNEVNAYNESSYLDDNFTISNPFPYGLTTWFEGGLENNQKLCSSDKDTTIYCYNISHNTTTPVLISVFDTDHLRGDTGNVYFDWSSTSINHTLTILNSTTNATFYTVGNISDTFYNYSSEVGNLTDGNYSWYVTAFFNGDSANSTISWFIIDNIFPDWTLSNYPSFFNDTIIRDNNFTFDSQVDDVYLFEINATLFRPNGTIAFNKFINNYNLTTYYLNDTIDLTNEPDGIYIVELTATDDHTLRQISNYATSKDFMAKRLNYDTGSSAISIRYDNKVGSRIANTDFSTTKLTDRYKFNYIMNTDKITLKTYSFRVVSDKKIYYREDLYPYPSFVTGKNWIDFNLVNDVKARYNVIKVNDFVYVVTVTTRANNLDFSSLGGLNIRTETYTMQVDRQPNVTIISPQNITYDSEFNYNFSLSYAVTDNVSNISMCWYEFNDTNTTLTNCENITFTALDDSNVITVYANDSEGRVGNDTVYFTLNIDGYPNALTLNGIIPSLLGETTTLTTTATIINGKSFITTLNLSLNNTICSISQEDYSYGNLTEGTNLSQSFGLSCTSEGALSLNALWCSLTSCTFKTLDFYFEVDYCRNINNCLQNGNCNGWWINDTLGSNLTITGNITGLEADVDLSSYWLLLFYIGLIVYGLTKEC